MTAPADAVPQDIQAFLGQPTPAAWVEGARARLPDILVDHANCERKAAATALSLMTRYPDRPALVRRLSRLAREELRHFEQVQAILADRGLARRRVSASRYASGLKAAAAREEPRRLVDQLLIGAFIEARSCERFALLAPHLETPLDSFYRGLLAAEARHFLQYLDLARQHRGALSADELDDRIDELRRHENRLIAEPDEAVRFHSGPWSGQRGHQAAVAARAARPGDDADMRANGTP